MAAMGSFPLQSALIELGTGVLASSLQSLKTVAEKLLFREELMVILEKQRSSA
jgi:hypothetical protein